MPIMREPAWMRCLALLKIAQSQAISRHPQRLVSARLAERACWTPSGPAKIKEAAHMMVKGSEGVTAAITREGKQLAREANEGCRGAVPAHGSMLTLLRPV